MIHTVYGNYEDSIGMMLAGHFVKKTGYPITGPYLAMGWIQDGKLIGLAIFNDYTGSNMEIHIHGPGAMTRRSLREAYNFVFNINGCHRLTAKVYTHNQKLLQVLERIGFVYEFTQEKYYKENDGTITDAAVYKLTRENVPEWIKLNDAHP